jgi:superfamily I DNA and/or RNA helicase
MERKEIGHNRASRNQALERIQQAWLIFTTCAGAGLGLLRGGKFPIVIIDESSQQTEPMSLVPLTKGCQKAILVGDHVQLRATVRKYTKILGFEISLFERLYIAENLPAGSLQRVMLNVQYRMHPLICDFPFQEFYEGKLKADTSCERTTLPEHGFPWPEIPSSGGQLERCVFVPCLGEEDVGHRSKGNLLQAELCKEIYRMIVSTSVSVAVLTPYTRQVKMLKDRLPGSATVTSIDGFQGQEADIIIYVTVRCNPHGDIGFLSDLRRLNVVLTRARSGLIVIGCPRTLTNTESPTSADEKVDSHIFGSRAVDQDAGPVWKRLVQSLKRVEIPLASKSIDNSLIVDSINDQIVHQE